MTAQSGQSFAIWSTVRLDISLTLPNADRKKCAVSPMADMVAFAAVGVQELPIRRDCQEFCV